MADPVLLYWFEDEVTGDFKSVVVPYGTTERDVRSQLGGIWLDAERTASSAPCPVWEHPEQMDSHAAEA